MPKSVGNVSDDDGRRKQLVIDASGLVLGRLASVAAKHLLAGTTLTIVNAEKAVVTGERLAILKDAHAKLRIRNLGTKSKSPKHARRPEGILRRTIRGMLPRDKEKGREAFSHLRVYSGAPDGVDFASAVKPREAENRSLVRLTTLGEIAQSIGWKPIEA
ncbi:50S ribosomal protein L13 [Candidatus Bathyarchaeota archaeon]|nr:50S ribosomal protein L13 [Candidatus Bathyarchaeota archaeon]